MSTTRFALPEIVAGQAQKEVTHNTALHMLSCLVGAPLITRTTTAPPGSPVDGGLYFVPTSATGAWSSRDGKLALYFASAWTFIAVAAGAVFMSTQDSQPMRWTGSAWTPAVNQIGSATSDTFGLYGVTPVAQPAGAGQAAVTLGNTDGEISGLSFSASPTQAECQALRDKCEELADDVRALSTLLHAIRSAGISLGAWKGAA